MSRLEAINEYGKALRQGKKYYSSCVSRGEDPYLAVLDEKVSMGTLSTMNIGIIEIPIERIAGTWTGGRKNAFAGNFMPLMDANSEFGEKWIGLCHAHLDENGITDPILCFEYLGNFYVQEGHKRVSVLKHFGASDIAGSVTRLIPPRTDEPEIQNYYEFLDFYKLSKLYTVTFSQPGSYPRLQAAMGFTPDQEWTEEARRGFNSTLAEFTEVFSQLNSENLQLTAGDALLLYLEVHPYAELRNQTRDELKTELAKLWPDVRLLARGEPISVNSEPEDKGKSLLQTLLRSPKLHAAFIYDFDPEKSPWASAHQRGQKYMEEKLGDQIEVSSYLSEDNTDECMEQAVRDGANVLFAVTPTLIASCRRIAADHKNIAVFNCSLSMPYAGVRGYYCRIYEAKYIAGAIAGAMAENDRIGYIAHYPIMGTPAAINAFALGAGLTNPRARISLEWTCLPGNPIRKFEEAGIRVISGRDADGANPALQPESGLYLTGNNGETRLLASPRWNWGTYYEKTMQSLIKGGIDALRNRDNAVNDWWGMSTGVVNVKLEDSLPEGLKQLAGILKQGIISGTTDPFLRPFCDSSGAVINDGTQTFTAEELIRMDRLAENVDGIIPAFDDLIPQSRGLVRLLGVYRGSIPPEAEEARP